MKTNRILYPDGKRTSAADMASSLDPGCFHPVTVKVRTYMVYRYEGPLNKIDHAVVLLSYPNASVGKKNALRVFLCSDTSLSDETILDYYANRWSIEVFFRSHKRYLGLKSFMVRSAKAFDRLLLSSLWHTSSFPVALVLSCLFTLAFTAAGLFSSNLEFAHL